MAWLTRGNVQGMMACLLSGRLNLAVNVSSLHFLWMTKIIAQTRTSMIIKHNWNNGIYPQHTPLISHIDRS
jgi:hypothetical protein